MSLYTFIALGYIIPRAEAQPIGAVSSGVEHYLDTVGVTSSNLVSPTKNDKTEEVFLLGLFLSNRLAGNAAAGMDPFLTPAPIGSRPKHNIWV